MNPRNTLPKYEPCKRDKTEQSHHQLTTAKAPTTHSPKALMWGSATSPFVEPTLHTQESIDLFDQGSKGVQKNFRAMLANKNAKAIMATGNVSYMCNNGPLQHKHNHIGLTIFSGVVNRERQAQLNNNIDRAAMRRLMGGDPTNADLDALNQTDLYGCNDFNEYKIMVTTFALETRCIFGPASIIYQQLLLMINHYRVLTKSSTKH
jgi:hypothetical protein